MMYLRLCLVVSCIDYSKTYKRILVKLRGGIWHGRKKKRSDFGGDPDFFCVHFGSFSELFPISR